MGVTLDRNIAAIAVTLMLAALASCTYAVAGETAARAIVKKSEGVLEIYDASGNVAASFAIALGGSPLGHKQREGDERTPEGHYILDWRNPDSGYQRSIHISYSDANDKARANATGVSTGGMIMIHGQRNGFGWAASLVQYFDWTNGCIAVTNNEMDIIWDMVPNGTPIEIRP